MRMIDFRWWRCLDGYRLEPTNPRRWTAQGRVESGLVAGANFGLRTASDRFEDFEPLKISGLFAIFAEDTRQPQKECKPSATYLACSAEVDLIWRLPGASPPTRPSWWTHSWNNIASSGVRFNFIAKVTSRARRNIGIHAIGRPQFGVNFVLGRTARSRWFSPHPA